MDDDRLDGIVIAEFLDLLHHRAGVENDAFQFHYADFVPETTAERRAVPACMEREINQCEHCQHEEEEGSSSNHDPEKRPRTPVFSHTDGLSLALGVVSGFQFLEIRSSKPLGPGNWKP